jgi:hypothetical protein
MHLVTVFAFSFLPGAQAPAPTPDFDTGLRLAVVPNSDVLPPPPGVPLPIDTNAQPISNVSLSDVEFGPPPPIDGIALEVDQSTLSWHDPTMDDMALDWGMATIGPGSLAPQPGLAGGRGGGVPGGGGRRQASTTNPALIPDGPSINIPLPMLPVPPLNPSGGQQPVPEPGAIAVWLMAGSAFALLRRQRGTAS